MRSTVELYGGLGTIRLWEEECSLSEYASLSECGSSELLDCWLTATANARSLHERRGDGALRSRFRQVSAKALMSGPAFPSFLEPAKPRLGNSMAEKVEPDSWIPLVLVFALPVTALLVVLWAININPLGSLSAIDITAIATFTLALATVGLILQNQSVRNESRIPTLGLVILPVGVLNVRDGIDMGAGPTVALHNAGPGAARNISIEVGFIEADVWRTAGQPESFEQLDRIRPTWKIAEINLESIAPGRDDRCPVYADDAPADWLVATPDAFRGGSPDGGLLRVRVDYLDQIGRPMSPLVWFLKDSPKSALAAGTKPTAANWMILTSTARYKW